MDYRTQRQLSTLLDTLEGYRMITVKRDRLEYIFEQNQAQAIKEAIPNPIGLLSSIESYSYKKLIASVVYMAVDSAISYKTAKSKNELAFLQDGWKLDDAEAEVLHECRKEAFEYMLDIVRNNNLPGELALSEDAVSDFVYWKNHTNLFQKIQFFETNYDTYKGYGGYWLTLASAYYENEEYEKCISSIKEYERLQIKIFRRDYEYAKTLPLAIASASELQESDEYLEDIIRWADLVLSNTTESEWALRYFTAQTFIDIYKSTDDNEYLRKAYDILLNNVNYLVNEQRKRNNEYISEVLTVDTPNDANKEEKKKIKAYNSELKDARKTELPPVYEAFIVNCDLLFELAKKLELNADEFSKINGILHENGAPVFLIDILDAQYQIVEDESGFKFGSTPSKESFDLYFNGSTLIIPASIVSDEAIITVEVTDDATTVFNEWILEEVNRRVPDDYSSYMAKYTSKSAGDYYYLKESEVHIEIIPHTDFADKMYNINMIVDEYNRTKARVWFIPDVLDSVTFKVVQ